MHDGTLFHVTIRANYSIQSLKIRAFAAHKAIKVLSQHSH